MDLFSLKGRVAVVTGASSGLGKRFAEVLAGQGADIVIMARRIERLQELAENIRKTGVRCLPLQCDVTDEQRVIEAVAEAVKHFGKIDILVNNAGSAYGTAAEDTPGEDFRKTIDVDLNGVFYMAREVGKNMIANKYGRIINIASMYGLVGNKFAPALSYHASKGAVVNFARGLAAEWGKHNITVNNIGPGFFMSELTEQLLQMDEFNRFVATMTCLDRAGKEHELDTSLLFLASDHSSYVTGQTIYVDGGWTAI